MYWFFRASSGNLDDSIPISSYSKYKIVLPLSLITPCLLLLVTKYSFKSLSICLTSSYSGDILVVESYEIIPTLLFDVFTIKSFVLSTNVISLYFVPIISVLVALVSIFITPYSLLIFFTTNKLYNIAFWLLKFASSPPIADSAYCDVYHFARYGNVNIVIWFVFWLYVNCTLKPLWIPSIELYNLPLIIFTCLSISKYS